MSVGQWIGATVIAVIVGLPIGMCGFFSAGMMSGSATVGFFAWGFTFLLAFIMAAGMLKAQADKRELQQRQLRELREKQG